MRNIAICIVLFALAVPAIAQNPEANYYGHGYVQFGIGRCSNIPCGTVHTLGAGGEVFVYRGLAAGGEGGYGWAQDALSAGAGLFSAGPSYHFKGQGHSRRVVPFVGGGYSMLFRQMSVNGGNLGAGITIWPAQHVGIRLEGRWYHFTIAGLAANITAARFGVSFR